MPYPQLNPRGDSRRCRRGSPRWHACRQLGVGLTLILAGFSAGAETQVFQLTLKDHLFSPSTLQVPAGQKVKIIIHNQDPNPEEFESFALNREKVILGGSKGVVFVGPLLPGRYPFIGEYNPDSAKGVLIALPPEQWPPIDNSGDNTSGHGADDAD